MTPRISPRIAPVHWVDQVPERAAPAPRRSWVRTLLALADVMFESDRTGPPPAERLAWLAAQTHDFLSRAGFRSRLVFRVSLLATAWLAPLLIGRPVTFRWLGRPSRIRALERYERSAVGVTLFAVKAIVCILYYEHPDAAAEIGFDGRCLLETPP